jgi:predicted RNA-binding Zn-ribbon protein involved in translation (DUF1610 family)
MFIREESQVSEHTRISCSGKKHQYKRTKRIVHFVCDNCGNEFTRPREHMDPKRLSNNYFHVCPGCNSKKFAQRRSIERKKSWDLLASSDLPVSRL